jgi:putative ABC transport system permease protein
MGALWRELRDAVRSLAANLGFTATVVSILALGIGANSTTFSVLQAVVLRPIPWENPERLVNLLEVSARQGGAGINNNPSTANYKDWREQNHVFDRMAAFRYVFFNFSDSRSDSRSNSRSDTRAEPERVPGMRVSADFFPLIGVRPALGRNFLPEEEQPGRDRVALLSNGCWRRRYGADPNMVGRAVLVEGESYAVIGVLPEFPMFRVANRTLDIYTPLALPSAALSREDHSLTVFARLRSGVTVARAQSEMDTIARRLAAAYPKTNADWTVQVAPLVEYFARRRRAMLEFLLAAAAFVLLIACANIASLTLARSVSRRGDLAIRMALGAGRLRIVRRLLAESLILAAAGGACGTLLAVCGTAFLNRSIGTQLFRMTSFRVDPGVLAFTMAISLASSVLFGLGPAIRASKFDVSGLLARASGRGATGRRDAGNLLIASEVALATMLLIGAAIAARSTQRLLRMDRGIDSHNVLTAQLWMPESRYATGAAERHFVDAALERLRALPGVAGASMVNYPPLGIVGTVVDVEIEGRPAPGPGESMTARFRVIDPEFFRTLRVPLVKGRAFETGDADEARGVAIVSEAFARRFFPGEEVIGKRFRPLFPGGDAYWYPRSANLPLRIVGIARDIHDADIYGAEPPPQMYLPYRQNPSRIMHLLVRTQGPPLDWAAAVRGAILAVDRDEPVFDVKTLAEIATGSFSPQSTFGAMLSAAAGLALLLAATGIYALLAWSVSRRTREIGIRMAIGAAPADLFRMVLRQSLQPALAGVLAGVAGAFALDALLRAQIAGTDGLDPIAFALPAVILTLAAAAAGIAPALRALRVDPIAALRME